MAGWVGAERIGLLARRGLWILLSILFQSICCRIHPSATTPTPLTKFMQKGRQRIVLFSADSIRRADDGVGISLPICSLAMLLHREQSARTLDALPYSVGPHVKERPSLRPILDRPAPGMRRAASLIEGWHCVPLSNSRHFRPFSARLIGAGAGAGDASPTASQWCTHPTQRNGDPVERSGHPFRHVVSSLTCDSDRSTCAVLNRSGHALCLQQPQCCAGATPHMLRIYCWRFSRAKE